MHQLAVQFTNAGQFKDAMEYLITVCSEIENTATGPPKKPCWTP